MEGQTAIIVIAGGFYYFGTVTRVTNEHIEIIDAAMFRGFSGGKGCPGVARGDKEAKVTLDCFNKDAILHFPMSACYGILPSINLYEFKGATVNR